MRCVSYNSGLKKLARQNRKNPPQPEINIWNKILRDRPINYKFTRQKPIKNFILDFYCSKLLLAVEIDGDTHCTGIGLTYDDNRTKILNSVGIKVVRYTNFDVTKNIDGVYDDLVKQIRTRETELS